MLHWNMKVVLQQLVFGGNHNLCARWLYINLLCLINYQQCTHFMLHSACFCDPANMSVRKAQL